MHRVEIKLQVRIRREEPMQKKLFCQLFLSTCLLAACSYDSEKALQNGDVINMHGPVYNATVFEEFLKSVKAKSAATVRIANYTPNGNPTLYDVSFDGTVFELKIDRSKNKERRDSPAIESVICTDIVTEEGQQLFSYTLEGCESGEDSDRFTLLNVLKDQDHDHNH